MKHRIYVVGIRGPGTPNMMAEPCSLIGIRNKIAWEQLGAKNIVYTPMRAERERCQCVFEKGKRRRKMT